MNLRSHKIQFEVNGKKYQYIIVHNLPDTFGMNIEGALDNWLARTNNFKAKSLCKYIMSKDNSFVAMTESQYNRINKYGK